MLCFTLISASDTLHPFVYAHCARQYVIVVLAQAYGITPIVLELLCTRVVLIETVLVVTFML